MTSLCAPTPPISRRRNVRKVRRGLFRNLDVPSGGAVREVLFFSQLQGGLTTRVEDDLAVEGLRVGPAHAG